MAQNKLAHSGKRPHNAGMFKNLLIAGLAAIVMPAFAAEWMTDLEAAKTKAAAENKAVLVDFTGSDWCGYCIRLKKNVFDTPEFETYAADKFVLVEIDVPNDVSRVGGAENAAKNHALCEQYQVSGFPTIMVLNADGKILGGFVGGQPDFKSTTLPLDAALANGRTLAEAEKLQGAEKAKALLTVYNSIPSAMQALAAPMIDEISALDPNNETGAQNILKETAVMNETKQALMVCKTPDAALAIVNNALPKVVSRANKDTLLQVKFEILSAKITQAERAAKTEEDILALKPLLLELVNCMPEQYRAATMKNIENYLANPAATLKALKSGKRK